MPSKASISASLFQLHPGERFRYRYNFFVFWERELRLEAAVALHGKLAHPRCVGGRRPAPDEARFVWARVRLGKTGFLMVQGTPLVSVCGALILLYALFELVTQVFIGSC